MTQLSDHLRRSAYAKMTDPVGLILLAAILTGSYLRFAGIGDKGFWTDELFHVFAARSFLTDGHFDVPWFGSDGYTRAMLVTLLTALSFRFFGENEATARFLFALTRLRTHKMDSLWSGFVIQGFRKETNDGSRLFLAQRGAILAP